MFAIKGHSGCSVNIVESNGTTIVRKLTADRSYFHRLQAQAQKQKQFLLDNTLPCVDTPEIIHENFEENSCYFDMDFYRSLDCLTFLQTCTVSDLDEFFDFIKSIIDFNVQRSPLQKFDKVQFLKKYESVKVNLESTCADFDKIDWEVLDGIMEGLGIHDIPCGFCHGDLTFSNILVKKSVSRFGLIDFLDCFMETPMQDIVKIRQDTRYNWSLNLYSERRDETKISIIMSYLDRKLVSFCQDYPFYNLYYRPFQLINLLRVLQYTSRRDLVESLVSDINILVQEG